MFDWLQKGRIAVLNRNLSRVADALETLARIEQDRWEREFAPRPKGKFIIGTLDQKAANEYYKETHRGEFDTD